MKTKTHIEFPMFGNRTHCGRRTTGRKGVKHVWTMLGLVTCKVCKRVEQNRRIWETRG